MHPHHVPQNSEQLVCKGLEKPEKEKSAISLCQALKRIVKVRVNFRGEFWSPTEGKVTELGNIKTIQLKGQKQVQCSYGGLSA